MYDTLLLDLDTNDLVVDAAGNIAVASPPYAVAQDVASALRVGKGELIYDTGRGVPWFDEILGELPPLAVFTGYLEAAALSVPGVVAVSTTITLDRSRQVIGQLQFIDETGAENGVNF